MGVKKLVVWVHSFPTAEEGKYEELLLTETQVSVYNKPAADVEVNEPWFKGSFNHFIDFVQAGNVHPKQVVVVLPEKNVIYTQVAVPSKSRKRIMQAIPFVIEDHLLQSTDTQHYALGDVIQRRCSIAIVDEKLLSFIYEQFRKIQWPLIRITSAAMILLWREKQWSFYFADDDILLRTSKQHGMTFSHNNLEFMFQLLLDKGSENNSGQLPESISIIGKSSTRTQPLVALAQQYEIPVEFIDSQFIINAFTEPYFKTEGDTINLLQGQFNPGNLKSSSLPFKKTLAAAVVIAICSQIVLMTYQWTFYQDELKKLESELEQLYFQTFPDSKRLIDVRSQTRANINALQKNSNDSSEFLSLLGVVGSELRKLNGIEIRQMQYNDGILQLEILSRDFVFNQIKEQFAANSSLKVEERASSRIKNKVVSTLNFRIANQMDLRK
jgi:general secretion pathway protein L